MSWKIDRRKFLSGITVSAGAFAFTNFFSKAMANTCGIIPPQTPGPFYPGESNFKAEVD